MLNRNAVLATAAWLSLVCSGSALAQTSSGSLTGTVIDGQGAAIPSATVTVTDLAKKTSFRIVTENSGRFAFPTLAPSTYDVTVEVKGFKKYQLTNQVLNSNDNLAVGDLTMQVGSETQSIQVEAQGIELKSESGERSESIVGKQLQNTLVNSRSYLDLTKLIPGVVSTVNLQTAGHGGVGSISANGARPNQNNLTLNGIGNVDTGNNGDQLATISLDSVQEFRILTSNYQAEYGRSSGAQISVVSKSGSSQLHGSGYLFHRNDSLNANNWKNNRDGLQRNKFRFNDAGYTIGGPIFVPKFETYTKNKAFFFFSQEYQNQLKPQNARNFTVPTALERQGDFSQSVDKSGTPYPYIRDYTLSRPCSAADSSGCFAAGGVLGRIPASRLDQPSLNILSVYPLPNAQRFQNSGYNFTSQVSDSYPRREDLLRLDYNVNEKLRLFGHYVNNNDSITSVYGSFVLGSNIPKVPITDARPGYSWAFGATFTPTPTIVNEFTVGTSKNQINIDPVNNGLTRAANGLSGLNVLYPNAIQQDFIPTFAFNGSRIGNTASFGTNNAPFFNFNSTRDWVDNLSKVFSKHIVKAGVYVQFSAKDQTSFANANGSFNFDDNTSNLFDTQYGFANAATGVYNSFTQASQYVTGRYRYRNTEFYLQDTWKVTRRLTLDYGMRFQLIEPQFDAAQQTSNFFPDKYNRSQQVSLYRPVLAGGVRQAQNPVNGQFSTDVSLIGKVVPGSGAQFNGVLQAGAGTSKYLVQDRGVHYAPRFGFAYDVTGKQNIVVRGGGGIFYDRFQGNAIFDELTNPPTTIQPTLVQGLISQINPANVVLAPVNLIGLSGEGKVPTVYNYSFGVESRLPYQIVLNTSYVGSLSRHLLQNKNFNAIPYGTTYLPQNQDPTKVASSPTAVLGSNAYDANFQRPYPGFGDITIHQFGASSNYNSLQVSANRRFQAGLLLGLAYTWSKALGVASGDGDFIRIDNLTRFANYGPLNFDRRQNLIINYIYDTPKLSFAKNFVTKAIFNGWQISGITAFVTGTPYGVGFSIPGIGNAQLTGSNTEGAAIQVLGNPKTGSDNPYHRINPAAFGEPQPGNIGLGAGRNYLTGPGINNWDISLQKQFSIRERMTLQLRADTFNTFNHTQFGGGGSNNSGVNATLNYTSLTNSAITNLPFKADGSVNNINGFGTVAQARDPRIMQLVVRLVF